MIHIYLYNDLYTKFAAGKKDVMIMKRSLFALSLGTLALGIARVCHDGHSSRCRHRPEISPSPQPVI